ncbi:MAG: hypothetical protein KF817_09800 [Phycisphaeraceae bacterium]|nr:hypothetical protein [Phycisphaeraceae bacterium]
MIDLGPIGFLLRPGDVGDSDLTSFLGTGTFGINGSGQVAFAVRVSGQPHAAVWLPLGGYGLPPGIHDLAALAETSAPSMARDITDLGTIVGQSGAVEPGAGTAAAWHLAAHDAQAQPPLPHTLFNPGISDPSASWTRPFAAAETAAGLIVVYEEARKAECLVLCLQGMTCQQDPELCRWFVTSVAALFDPATQTWGAGFLPNTLPGMGMCIPGVIPGDVMFNALGHGVLAGSLSQIVNTGDPGCPPQSAFCTSCGEHAHAGHWVASLASSPQAAQRLDSLPPPPCPPDPPPHGAVTRGINQALDTVGYAWQTSGASCLQHAALWPAGNASLVNLHAALPTGSGLDASRTEAISGGASREIVGYVPVANLPLLWTESPSSSPPWAAEVLDAADPAHVPDGHCGDDAQIRHLLDVNSNGWIVAWGMPVMTRVRSRNTPSRSSRTRATATSTVTGLWISRTCSSCCRCGA